MLLRPAAEGWSDPVIQVPLAELSHVPAVSELLAQHFPLHLAERWCAELTSLLFLTQPLTKSSYNYADYTTVQMMSWLEIFAWSHLEGGEQHISQCIKEAGHIVQKRHLWWKEKLWPKDSVPWGRKAAKGWIVRYTTGNTHIEEINQDHKFSFTFSSKHFLINLTCLSFKWMQQLSSNFLFSVWLLQLLGNPLSSPAVVSR